MPRYSDEILDEVRRNNDIIDIISQYTTLKRKGRNYFACCPFHNEKTPSFSVSPDKQIFKCFGCGVGGDVVHFLMKIENISFPEAVQELANRAHIQLPTSDDPKENAREALKAKVYKVNDAAALFYHEQLYNSKVAKEAQSYVKMRKMNNNTLKSFMIGYSGDNNELLAYLKEKGFSEEEMLASNLIGKNSSGRLYDKFRHRLMFPIQDVRGRTIAFGGRVLDNSKPKYINSPEDIVYSKGRNLFGLNVARRGQTGLLKRILIVEGYMDAISLYQNGITNVVASLGTALTQGQGWLLRKNAEQVILGYDADGAGQTAIIRGIDILKSMGIDIRILQISGAKDPDEFVVKYGPDKFRKCMDDAISVVEYKIKVLKQKYNLNNTSDKIKFLNEIAKILADEDNTIEREVYIDKIAKTYQISREAILAEINKITNKTTKVMGARVLERPDEVVQRRSAPNQEFDDSKINNNILKKEQMIIYLLVNHRENCYERIKKAVNPKYIKSKKNLMILEKLLLEENKDIDSENIIGLFDDQELIDYLSGILVADFEIEDEERAITDIEHYYLKESRINRRNEILDQLKNKDQMSKEEVINLENELNVIIMELAKIK